MCHDFRTNETTKRRQRVIYELGKEQRPPPPPPFVRSTHGKLKVREKKGGCCIRGPECVVSWLGEKNMPAMCFFEITGKGDCKSGFTQVRGLPYYQRIRTQTSKRIEIYVSVTRRP